MGAGIVPAHKKSYQLGVLATPVQIRTDPFRSGDGADSPQMTPRPSVHGHGGTRLLTNRCLRDYSWLPLLFRRVWVAPEVLCRL